MSNETVGSIWVPLLTTLFIGLKLTGHITWSWLWVLWPVWLPVTIAGMIFLLGLVLIIFGRS